MYCVGSAALVEYGHLVSVKDIDIIMHSSEFSGVIKKLQKQYKLVKLDFTSTGASAVFSDANGGNIIIDAVFTDKSELDLQLSDFLLLNLTYTSIIPHNIEGINLVVVKPEVVLMMKLSHRYKKDSAHFLKTMRSIKFLREAGVKLDAKLEQHLVEREKLTYKLWNQKPYKLNVKSGEFFTDNVTYKYVHDSVHEAVKHLWKPAYTYYIQDNAEVMCSKEKFFDMPEHIRLLGVLEETYVLALERAIIPFSTNPRIACNMALERVCTSITSGWFREYAWENYDKVASMIDVEDLMRKYNKALQAGELRLFTPNP